MIELRPGIAGQLTDHMPSFATSLIARSAVAVNLVVFNDSVDGDHIQSASIGLRMKCLTSS